MKNYVQQDLKRAFLSKRTVMMYLFSITLFFAGMFQYIQWLPSQSVSIIYTFLAGYNSSTFSYLALVFPIVASIPYATSYFEDCQSGFNKSIYTRMNRRKYLHIRTLTNALVGGFTLAIGPSLAIVFLVIMDVATNATMVESDEYLETFTYLSNQGITSPLLMMFVMVGVIFLSGAVIATFTLRLSTLLKNSYFTALSSFFLLLISATILTKFSAKFSLVSLYDVDHFGMTFVERFIYEIILVAIGLVLIYKNGRRLEAKYV